jgi:O-antigen ligase
VNADRRIATPVVLTGILAGLIVAATFREGAFYPADATLVLVVSLVVAVALLFTRPERRTVAVVAAVGALALWWLVRAAAQGRAGSFVPLGASMVGFAAAFLATRRLEERYRVLATQFVVGVGAVSAAAGLVATTSRWYPLAMPAQNLWRLSTTLTYSNAAGALLAVALLAGLGLEQRANTTKLMVCLCAAGLVATQSRGAVLGAVVGLVLVPLAQLRRAAITLGFGIVGGLAVVATSSGGTAQPLATAAVVVAVAIAVVVPRRGDATGLWTKTGRRSIVGLRKKVAIGTLVAVATIGIAVGAGVVLRVPIERRVALGSSEDRGHEWTAAFDQFRSSPVVGVGPDQLLYFHAADGDFAHFSHNEYLQVLADGGLVGELLLVVAGIGVIRAVRREDIATSCAAGALVAFAVVGTLDFDWHLAALGLVGGWVAGLAGRSGAASDPVFYRSAGAPGDVFRDS